MNWLPLMAVSAALVVAVGALWLSQGAPGNSGVKVSAEVTSLQRLPTSATATPVPTPTPGIVTPAGTMKAPEFRGIVQWLNSEPLTLEEQRGQVVLIDFWTYT